MSWTSGFVNSKGRKLHYMRTGGDKRPLLLAHGHTDDGACWTEFTKLLEDDYDVIMYDAIGHGDSDRITMDMEINLGSDMGDVIRELGLEKPAIWGHSMGAGTTVDYANDHADEVSLIILEDVGWFDGDFDVAVSPLAVKPYDIANLQKGTLEESIELSKKIHPRHKDFLHECWAVSKMKYDTTWAKRGFRPTNYDWRNEAHNLTCPTLLLTAEPEKGGLLKPEIAVEALSILPKGQWNYFPNSGHTIRYEQFDLVMGVVKNYLRQNYPA